MKKIIKIITVVFITSLISIPTFSFSHYLNLKDFANSNKRIKYKPTDPYYLGIEKVSNKYQNILFNNIGNIENVWDEYTGKGVLVADIDSGIDINHPDFSNNIHEESAYFYTEYENDDIDSPFEVKSKIGLDYIGHDYDEKDHSWISHGTSTAGVIASESDLVGTIGVAFDAQLLVLKVDFEDYSINEAIKYAVDKGAKVINMSFGGYAEPYYDHYLDEYFDEENVDYYPGSDTSMIEAINYAYNHGVILVASAGNECTDTHSYPACNEHVIGVGALKENSDNTAANYSNYNSVSDTPKTNPSVDIVAPGTVVTTDYSGSKTRGHSSYTKISGTSFSCPVVVGAAALWKEKNPFGTHEQFEKQLFESANDIGSSGWDKKYGYGALDVEKLLLNDEEPILNYDEITSMSINIEKVSIEENKDYLLVATVNPLGTPFNAIYTSSNPEIATVNNAGRITGIKEGNTTITVTINDLSATCEVEVTKAAEKEDDEEIRFNICGGNIATTSTFLSLISILGFFLLKVKKYK